MNTYGPVTLSEQMLQWFREVDDRIEDADLKDAIEKRPIELGKELVALIRMWGEDYPLDVLMEIDGTGLLTHITLDEIALDCGFEIDGKQGDGGSDVRKQWKRVENPVNNQVTVKVTRAHDGTEGKTTVMPGGKIVRPHYGGPRPDGYVGSEIPTPEEVRDYKQRDTDYRVASDAIEVKVAARLGDNYDVAYSAYESDERSVPIDNLDEVAIEGQAILVCNSDYNEGEYGDYQSEVVENPTWLDMCVLMNAMIKRTGDFHHAFLEGVYQDKKEEINGIPVYRFSTGS